LPIHQLPAPDEVIVCAFGNERDRAGKTTVGISIAEYIAAADARKDRRQTPYPALVVGPGVVTGKENWPKEIPEVTPGALGRVVDVSVKALAKPARIGAYLRDTLGLTLDEGQLEGHGAEDCLAAVNHQARRQKVPLGEAVITALRASLKRGEKSPPPRRRGARQPNLLDSRIGGYAWLGLGVSRDQNSEDDLSGKYSLAQFIADHRAGALPEKSFAILSYETAKLGSGRVPAMTRRTIRVYVRDETEQVQSRLVTYCACPHCGGIVAEKYDDDGHPREPVTPAQAEQFIGTKRRFCQAPITRRFWDPETGRHKEMDKDSDGRRLVCGAPLFENSALRRVPAAEYAKKKARGVFGLCLVDEIHQAKSKGTGVGFSLMNLTRAARYVLGLTGTLFAGYSTSIFWLLYRLVPEVRQQFAFNDEQRWVEKYGLLKRTFFVDADAAVPDDGAFTGTKFFETVSEKPGISPAIAGLGLKYCTFSSLKDVGLPLPAYSEEVVRIPMTPEMRAQYEDADGSQTRPPEGLFRWALDTMEEETGKGAISVWLNAALNRPDAMFRPEQVFFNRRLSGRGKWAVRRRELVRQFGAVLGSEATTPMWLPKEEWTTNTALAEYHQGRKTLVYVRQTGERDIQPRLQECLRAHGLRVGVLKPSLAPARRASWIKQHVHEFDVLLTNARLVQVGLNLTMFSTAIFFEMEWSLAVVWQAMRRLYRPGAPKPVRLYFPVYESTLEEAALDLIGAKMLAAQVFYGDEVGGALVDEGDEGNLLNDLVRKAMGELTVGRSEGVFSSGNDMLVTEAPYGSPTAISPMLETWKGTVTTVSRRRRRVEVQSTAQLSLF